MRIHDNKFDFFYPTREITPNVKAKKYSYRMKNSGVASKRGLGATLS